MIYNGTLEIEIGGDIAGSGYDQINHILVHGIAELGGTLEVELIDEFVPGLGDTFDILTATGGVNGTFTGESLPDLGPLLAMDVLYDTNIVTLSVVPALDGDFDVDGDVDGADFLLWQRGGSPDPLSASDLSDWQTNFGATLLTGTSTTVPEPSTWILLFGGLVILLNRQQWSQPTSSNVNNVLL